MLNPSPAPRPQGRDAICKVTVVAQHIDRLGRQERASEGESPHLCGALLSTQFISTFSNAMTTRRFLAWFSGIAFPLASRLDTKGKVSA